VPLPAAAGAGSGATPRLDPVAVSEVDPELEELRRSIEKL
jgi:hypothetical protein